MESSVKTLENLEKSSDNLEKSSDNLEDLEKLSTKERIVVPDGDILDLYPDMEKITIYNEKHEEVARIANTNPFFVKTPEECEKLLNKLVKVCKLPSKDKKMVNICINILKADDDYEIKNSMELIEWLNKMMKKNPKFCREWDACYTYISDQIEFEGDDLPDKIYDEIKKFSLDLGFSELFVGENNLVKDRERLKKEFEDTINK